MISRVISTVILFFVLSISACRNDQFVDIKSPDCDTTEYQRSIKPLIIANCAIPGCHDGTNATPNYNNYQSLKEVIEKSVNNKPEILYRIDLPVTDPDHMPNSGEQLSNENRLKIQNWINEGYPGCE